VQSGDVLSTIAHRYLGAAHLYPQIMEATGITSTNLYLGQELIIP